MAYEVFRARIEANYEPFGPAGEIAMSVDDLYDIFENDMDSEEAFTARFLAYEQEMWEALATVQEVSSERDHDRILKISEDIQEGGILKSARLVDSLHMSLVNAHLPEESYMQLRKSFSHIRMLATPFLKIDSFLEQEAFMLKAAAISAPEDHQDQIAAAAEEVTAKIAKVEEFRTPQGLYKMLTREQRISELIALGAYTTEEDPMREGVYSVQLSADDGFGVPLFENGTTSEVKESIVICFPARDANNSDNEREVDRDR